MCHLNIGNTIYDAETFNSGVVIGIEDNNVIYRDDNFNTFSTSIENAYKVNDELSVKYGLIICDEHNNLEGEYPYYIPIADENAYDFELEHFSSCYT